MIKSWEDKPGNEAKLCCVVLFREHAGRTRKGMQLLILPLYGGLPYSEQVDSMKQLEAAISH